MEEELDSNFKTVGNIRTEKSVIMNVEDCNVYYGDVHALKNVNMEIEKSEVISLIGPSGCGKSTFIRCLNRLNDTIDIARVTGKISLDGKDIYSDYINTSGNMDVVLLRARVGMVFQKPNPFPKSIFENVAYGPKIHGLCKDKNDLNNLVESCLVKVGLWDEVKDRLEDSGTSLSGGQQQRLCIARAIAVQPEVILMDEPCSALDPIATERIEDLISELKQNYALVVVTHSMQQASRISLRAAYFHMGNLVEVDSSNKIFNDPSHPLTTNYISGRIC